MSRSVVGVGSPSHLHTQSDQKPEPPPEGLVTAEYSLVRAAQRFVPKGLVTVTVGEGGFPLAFGEVRDLSESGACMVTDFVLGRGRSLQLQLRVDDRLTLETDARIVWSGEGKDSPFVGEESEEWDGAVVGAVLQGVEFSRLPDELRQRLRDLLMSGAFELAPGQSLVSEVHANSFQDVLEELQPELNELAVKVSPI